MSNSEILGLHRITKKHLRDLCKKHKLYQTPDLNDQLYLHFQGFQSIENLEEYTGLKCLWLESNAISEIQGLDCQTKLKCLFLQNNLIKKIENLQCCTSLDTLNLSSNHITKIENCGTDILPELSTLNLSRNYLQNSDAIRELVKCNQLWSLDLSHNRIDDILVVKIFAQMPELRVLVLQGNPVVSKVPQYRKTLILECKNLTYLDSRPVFPKDRACAEAWKRGGYEEERKEHDRWNRMDRKKTRDSVNATLRLHQKHGAGDIQLLESSDDENDKNDQNKLNKIPKDGTSSGDLEIIGVTEKVSRDLSDSTDSSSSHLSDEEKEYRQNKGITKELLKINNTKEFEEKLLIDEDFNRGGSCSKKIVENNVLIEEYKNEEKCFQETYKDIKIDGSAINFETSEYEKAESKEENAEKSFDNCYLQMEDIKCKREDQEMLQKLIETNKENDSSLSNSDFSEQNESTTKHFSSSSSEPYFENISSSDSKNGSSDLEMEKDAVSKSEDQGILQEPMKSNKENDSSFLSLSNSDFSEQNTSTTKSLSSYSSESSFASAKKNNNSQFSEQNESTKSFSSSSTSDNGNYSSEMKKGIVFRSEDQEILQDSIETNNEIDFSLSMKSLPYSSSFKKKSSSDVSYSKKFIEVVNQTNLDEEYKIEETCVMKMEKNKCGNSKLGLEADIVRKSKDADGTEKFNFCNKVMSEPSNIKIENESSKISREEKLNQNSKLTLNRNNNSSSESPEILTERKTIPTNLSEPLNNTGARIKNIFEMILTDEDSDLTDETLEAKTIEDTIASSWLENFLIKEVEKENSQPRKLIEEIINNDSCIALYDSTETTIASDWLELENKENVSSFLSLSNSDFSEQNNSTKSLSSEASFKNNSTSYSKNVSSRVQESIETLLSSSNSDFLEENNSAKISPSTFIKNTSSDESEFKEINEIEFSEKTESKDENEENQFDNSKLEHHFYGEELNHSLEEDIEEFKSFNALERCAFLNKAIKENGDLNEIFEEPIEISEHSKFSDEEPEGTFSNLGNDLAEKISENRKINISILFNEHVCEYEGRRKENEENLNLKTPQSSDLMVQEQNSTNPDQKQYFETDLQANANEEKSLIVLVSKEDEHSALFGKNEEICRSSAEDYFLENNSQSSSWWERTLAAARIEVSKKANEDTVKDNNAGSELLKSAEEQKLFAQGEKDVSEVPVLEDQEDASNFLVKILDTIIDAKNEAPIIKTPLLNAEKENSQKYMEQYAEDASGSHNTENKFSDNSSSSFEPSLTDTSSVSTLRGVVQTFNEVVENISSRNRQKSQVLKDLIANPLTKTFLGQTGEQINRQVEDLKQQKLEQLSNYVNIVYAQREKYDDTLDVVNGRLMVVKRSTGALEELPPPPLSQRTGSTKYISCGVSTTPTSCNDDDDGDGDSDDSRTALSEDNDNDNDDEEENDIEHHASDTKIKSIPTSSSDMNYYSNESVSLSSAGSSTKIEKEEEYNNHHHSDVVDDSQRRVAGRLHNEIDSEVLPESSKWLENKEASASVAVDYKLSSKGDGDTQTRSEFQVELEDSFQSFMDFGENAAALEDIALIFENPEAYE